MEERSCHWNFSFFISVFPSSLSLVSLSLFRLALPKSKSKSENPSNGSGEAHLIGAPNNQQPALAPASQMTRDGRMDSTLYNPGCFWTTIPP